MTTRAARRPVEFFAHLACGHIVVCSENRREGEREDCWRCGVPVVVEKVREGKK